MIRMQKDDTAVSSMKNIILIGMPGCGKSTAGVLLAKILGYSFLDTDLLLQQRAGKKLYEIIRDDGMDAFLQLENDTVAALEDVDKMVIATGGSVVLGEAAMERLDKMGQIVYLQLPLSQIQQRISNIKTRGIAMSPGENLGDVYGRRVPLYEQYADITVSAAFSLEKTVEDIVHSVM